MNKPKNDQRGCQQCRTIRFAGIVVACIILMMYASMQWNA